VAILVCVGVQLYFLFERMVIEFIKTIKKIRKKGWIKTFPSLRKMRHIFKVVTCRKKLNLKKLLKK
jgi:hypothetical protein